MPNLLLNNKCFLKNLHMLSASMRKEENMSKISEFLDFANGTIVKCGKGYFSIIWTTSGKIGADENNKCKDDINKLIIWFSRHCKGNESIKTFAKKGYICIRDYPSRLFLVLHLDFSNCKIRVIKCANLYKSWPRNEEYVVERLLDGEIKNYIWKKR